jgi:replicative DNA helicase
MAMAPTLLTADSQYNEITGASTLAEVMAAVSQQVAVGQVGHLRPATTGFSPLDDVLNGGLRPGDLFVIGGPSGIGKTIFSLQMARNVVVSDPEANAMYICYEHDRAHLMTRLLCLESAELGLGDEALTLRRLNALMVEIAPGAGLIERLRANPLYAPVVDSVERYASRLHLVKASGLSTTLDQIRLWARRLTAAGPRAFMVVDYLQKIPVDSAAHVQESEVTTLLAQGLKELAMSAGIRILAVAAADRMGLQSKRMRLHDMRGSSAIQYEADIGAVFNNKFNIVSREHIVYNPVQAEAMRNWVVMSIEKNRSGRHSVDMEFHADASHFHLDPKGGYVRERLIDDRITVD